jgi:prepilin-type N-terminal cleavage/methylation domain-containing protein
MERVRMGELMTQGRRRIRTRAASSDGFSLIEVIISTAILATGLLTLAGYMAYGLAYVSGSSFALLAREKAREAVESVHTARDTGRLSWTKIQNQAQLGVFKDNFTDLKVAGVDGLINTNDDGAIEEVRTPGVDGLLGNADDLRQPLTNFQRQIIISPLMKDGTSIVNPNLRMITVNIKYTVRGIERMYTITTYVSSYS